MAAGWVAVVLAPFVTHAALVSGRFRLVAAGFAACQVVVLARVAIGQAAGWRRLAGLAAAGVLLSLLLVRLWQPAALGQSGLIAASAASYATIYLSLLTLFGSTLLPGRTALITALAIRVRGGLTPSMLRYTRKVTEAWCVFFAAQLTISAALLVVAPAALWSLYVNVLDAPLVVAMFVAENVVRRIRFPGYHHISPLETARHFRRPPA